MFLENHTIDKDEKDADFSTDNYVHFAAKVTKLYYGTFRLGENEEDTYIRCFADTFFGELEFDHTLQQVPPELQKNIRVGSIIEGVCLISADAAINKDMIEESSGE